MFVFSVHGGRNYSSGGKSVTSIKDVLVTTSLYGYSAVSLILYCLFILRKNKRSQIDLSSN
jgi:hypothetical protein